MVHGSFTRAKLGPDGWQRLLRGLAVVVSALSAASFGAAPAGAAGTEVYRFVDAEGTIVLSDQPPGNDGVGFRHVRRDREGRLPRDGAEASVRENIRNVGATFTIIPGSGARSVRRASREAEPSLVYEYYAIEGKNAMGAIADAGRKGPFDEAEGRRFAAQTQWSIGWSYNYEYFLTPLGSGAGWVVSAEVRSVDVAFDVRVLLPSPGGTGEWSEGDWVHWEGYLAGLRDHEAAHVKIATDPAVEKGIVSDLTGLYEFEWGPTPHPPTKADIRAAVEEEVYALGSRWIDLVRERNEEFDRMTGHGLAPEPGYAYLAALGLR